MSKKKPLFIDADRIVIGTLIRYKEAGEKGLVYPVYVPLNSIKEVTYPFSIQQEFIHIIPGASDLPGAEPEVHIVSTGDKYGMLSFINSTNQAKIKELMNQVQTLKIEVASASQLVEDAASGEQKTLARLKEINRTKTDDSKSSFGEDFFKDI